MGDSTIRIGWRSSRGGAHDRPPGIGRHFALFHFARIGKTNGRVMAVGYLEYNRADLEPLRERNTKLRVRVVGMLRLADDISPALREEVLDDVHVTGIFRPGMSERRA